VAELLDKVDAGSVHQTPFALHHDQNWQVDQIRELRNG